MLCTMNGAGISVLLITVLRNDPCYDQTRLNNQSIFFEYFYLYFKWYSVVDDPWIRNPSLIPSG